MQQTPEEDDDPRREETALVQDEGGRQHQDDRFVNFICYRCGRKGHMAGSCPHEREEASGPRAGGVGESCGQRPQPRGAPAPTELAAGGQPGHIAAERVCRCLGSNPRPREDVVVRVEVGTDSVWVPLDTEARLIWVDRTWFQQHGGTLEEEMYSAFAADGHEMEVCRRGILKFDLISGRAVGRGIHGASKSGVQNSLPHTAWQPVLAGTWTHPESCHYARRNQGAGADSEGKGITPRWNPL